MINPITIALFGGVTFLMLKNNENKAKLPLNLAASGVTLAAKMKSINDLFGPILKSEADKIGIPVSTAAAILAVESSGRGTGKDGKLLIRFEPKVFSNYTNISVIANHSSNAKEHETLEQAKKLDEIAAYKSISMGIGQIMGFNAKRVGYQDAQTMFEAFSQSLEAQITAMFRFIATDKGLLQAAKTDNFAEFARKYNGSGYAANSYDAKLANAKQNFTKVTGLV